MIKSYFGKLLLKNTRGRLAGSAWLFLALLLGLFPLFTGSGATPARALQSTAGIGSSPIPTLAYYYIWFDVKSWDRAKIDTPLLGRYSSDDRAVMREQIRWAKAAGIKGFIVSWKSTDTLNR